MTVWKTMFSKFYVFTYHKGNYHARYVDQQVLSIVYMPFHELFQQTTTSIAIESDVEHKGSCPSRYVGLQVRRFVYISCHELGLQNSISFLGFSCYLLNRSSYHAMYIGQQVP